MPKTPPPPGVQLVTLRDVEIARTGTWATSTGVFTFTVADFEAAVAAQHDPEVWDAPLKIGHTDPRFAGMDGEPALGWVENVRVNRRSGDDASLMADLVDVPKALADIIPKAYKRRSVELAFQVKTPSGNRYRAAVVGLALLGVSHPAVAGLSDVFAMYDGDTTFTLAEAAAEGGTCTVLYADGLSDQGQVRQYHQARTSIGELAKASNAAAPVTDALLAVVDALAGMPAASSEPADGFQHAGRRDDPIAGGPQVNEARIRQLLQLEEGADLEAAIVKLHTDAAATTPPAGTATTPPAGTATTPPAGTATTPPAGAPAGTATTPPAGTATTPPAGTATTPPAGTATTPPAGQTAAELLAAAGVTLPAGLAVVDTGVLAQLQQGATAGIAAATALATQARETALATHMTGGRITPASLEQWRAQWDRDPAGTQALLATLPVAFATTDLGTAVVTDAAPVADAAWDEWAVSLWGADVAPATNAAQQ